MKQGTWRRDLDPQERMEADARRYADAVVATLAAEWATVQVVRNAKAVGIARIRRILKRSSADSLLGPVLSRMVKDGLINVDGEIVEFRSALIKRFEAKR